MKILKKAVAAITAVSMLVSYMCIFAAQGGKTEAYLDFEKKIEFVYSQCVSTVDSGDAMYGNSLLVTPIETLSYAQREFDINPDAKNYVLSFDFKAKQTDHIFRMLVRDTNRKDITSISWDQNGKLVVPMTGQTPYNLSKGATYDGKLNFKEIGYYDDNWHNLTVSVNPNGSKTKLYWYYDGEFVLDADTTLTGLAQCTGILKCLYVVSTQTGAGCGIMSGESLKYDGDEGLLIDNITVSTYTDNVFYANMLQNNLNSVNVSFTEALNPNYDLSNIKVRNTETGKEVAIAGVEHNISNLYISFVETLIPSTEYRIEVDGLQSCMKKELLTDLYFVTGSSDGGIKRGNILYDDLGENVTLEKNKSFIFAINGEEKSDFIVDAYVTVKNPVSNSMSVYLQDANNNIMISSKISNDTGNFSTHYTTTNWLDNAVVTPENPNYATVVDAFSQDVPVKLTYITDNKARTVSLYINDEFVMVKTKPIADSRSMKVGKLYFGYDPAKYPDTSITVSDVAVYKPESTNKVSKFRMFNRDGGECEPYTQKTLATSNNAKIYFNCDVDESTLSTENIKIQTNGVDADYTVGEYNYDENYVNIIFNSFLTKGAEYTVMCDNLKDKSENEIQSYSTKFTVSEEADFYIDETYFADASGTEITADGALPDTAYLNTHLVNYTDSDVNIKLSLISLDDGARYNIGEKQYTVAANTELYDNTLSVKMPSDTEKTNIAALFTNENDIPYKAAYVLNTNEYTNDGRFYNFEKVYADKPNSLYYAQVFVPNKTADNLNDESAQDVVAARVILCSDENGKINIPFRIKDSDLSGLYTVKGVFEDGIEIDGNIPVSNPKDAENIIKNICDDVKNLDAEAAKQNIKNYMVKNSYALKLDYETVAALDNTLSAEILYNYINSLPNKTIETDLGLFAANKALIVNSLLSGNKDNLFDYYNQLEINKTRIAQFDKSSFNTDEFKKSVTQGIKDGGYTVKTFDGFNGALYEQFVLKTVKAPDGADNLKNVMNEFYTEIGVPQNASDKAYTAVSGNDYTNYGTLASYFNSANEENRPAKRGGGVGGGSTPSGGIKNVDVSGDYGKSETPTQINKDIFSDIGDVDWAKDEIIYLAEKNIINGKSKDIFAPNDNVTRAEMAKLIVSAFLKDEVEQRQLPFADVDAKSWAHDYIKKAYSAGVINGISGNEFAPDAFITRQDAAVMLYRAAETFGIEFYAEDEKRFNDENLLADYALDAVNKMYNMGFVNGVGNDTFAPYKNTTRAECAKIIYGMLKQ